MAIAKYNMVEQQIRSWQVFDQHLLDIARQLTRKNFVPSRYQKVAYADFPIPLAHGQIMLEPKAEARIVQSLAIQPSDAVLEIGTGTGYMTALLANCAEKVTSVDIFPEFTQTAAKNLEKAGIHNVDLITADASLSDAEYLKNDFDVIVVTGAFPEAPSYLYERLAVGGRAFTIIGQAPAMAATLTTRVSANLLKDNIIFETVVPFLLNIPLNGKFTL